LSCVSHEYKQGVHKFSSIHLYTAVSLGEVSDQVHALDDIPQGQKNWFPLNRQLGRFQTQSGHFREGNNFLLLPVIKLHIIMVLTVFHLRSVCSVA